jgi:hypothetical protein
MILSDILRRTGYAAVAAAVVLGASCASDLTRTGKSPAYLVIDTMAAAAGASPGTFANPLNSDVQTLVPKNTGSPTVFNDLGRASIRLALKNLGSTGSPTTPTSLNDITITRYHVNFIRADGRNTPGVDVPYAFDGGVTATISGTSPATVVFELVHQSMKLESPLKNLVSNGGAILFTTIAEVTFYGRDQAGNEVSVMGTITVNFGDFADP